LAFNMTRLPLLNGTVQTRMERRPPVWDASNARANRCYCLRMVDEDAARCLLARWFTRLFSLPSPRRRGIALTWGCNGAPRAIWQEPAAWRDLSLVLFSVSGANGALLVLLERRWTVPGGGRAWQKTILFAVKRSYAYRGRANGRRVVALEGKRRLACGASTRGPFSLTLCRRTVRQAGERIARICLRQSKAFSGRYRTSPASPLLRSHSDSCAAAAPGDVAPACQRRSRCCVLTACAAIFTAASRQHVRGRKDLVAGSSRARSASRRSGRAGWRRRPENPSRRLRHAA